MPQLRIVTNVPKEDIPDGFLKEVTDIFQQLINKPMKWISVLITSGQMMTFAGTDEPCALMHVGSIGNLELENRGKISQVLFPLIKTKLGIDGTRAYLTFHDQMRDEVAYNGKTFAS